jgi:hypothetical protein
LPSRLNIYFRGRSFELFLRLPPIYCYPLLQFRFLVFLTGIFYTDGRAAVLVVVLYIYNDALFSYIFIYCLIFSLFIVLLVHCRICYIDTSLRTLPANKVFLDSSCLQATFTRVIICIHVEILVSQEYACFFLQTSFCVLLETFLCFARDT